ncbi:uncharacterized protein BDR25DRAFT_292997 [Lindgomyces ingoldianus]|uniref:Uncharacterized protein n=1 Tax=Lindgomyces ingoldianus TaxID=673940 RepID=A0ACB6QI89_9PLEO|nr:uncharacterized protein BDR25DRAFT_292997 [Lindgomyces ingoldianus]KAF2466668.1 hypothetical protein BDR25DRAFT_292997 [Lindgomyces ingoldianus]
MKEIRRTEVPPPGVVSKKKTKSPQTPSKLQLSTEFVGSSDDSGTETIPKAKQGKKPSKGKTPVTIGVHKPGVNGVPKKSQKSTPISIAAKKRANQRKGTPSSSSDDSDNANNQSVDYEQWQRKGDKSEGSSNESRTSSDSSSDDSDKEEINKANQRSAEKQVRAAQSHTVEFLPAQPFIPPKGFTAVPTHTNPSSQALKIFDNIEGKQIWHITAPASVSLSGLKDLASDKVLKGEPILSYNGTDYGFSVGEEKEEATRRVLVPSTVGYKAVPTRISQTLHLQQVIRLPKVSPKQADTNTTSAAAASITTSTVRAPRPQVKGLRMRYFPSGFGLQDPGIIGSSESEDDVPVTAGLGIPNGIHPSQKREKRKYDEVNGTERTESATKKHKKHRTPEEIKKREEKKAKKERKKEKGSAKMK